MFNLNNINQKYLIGADESGAGCNAGILTVVAVKAPVNWKISGLNDSKKLSKNRRATLFEELSTLTKLAKIAKPHESHFAYSLAISTNDEIDQLGLAACLDKCYKTAIINLYDQDSYVIWDGNRHIKGIESICTTNTYTSLIKADSQIPHVMAASIIAKHYKDTDMAKKHLQYPQYNWINNSGYPTKDHKEAIKSYGYNEFHRRSYNIKLD